MMKRLKRMSKAAHRLCGRPKLSGGPHPMQALVLIVCANLVFDAMSQSHHEVPVNEAVPVFRVRVLRQASLHSQEAESRAATLFRQKDLPPLPQIASRRSMTLLIQQLDQWVLIRRKRRLPLRNKRQLSRSHLDLDLSNQMKLIAEDCLSLRLHQLSRHPISLRNNKLSHQRQNSLCLASPARHR